jgi:2-hydroxycyclohexanecarboxyl-CoA dehydrogenase
MGRLKNKFAIITGGAGGIGAATAQLFCEEGAGVLLVDLPESPLDDVVRRLRERVPGAHVVGMAADLGEEPAAAAVVRGALAQSGRIDVLVNNAGIRAYEPLAEAQAQTWHRILAVNLLSYAFLTREALPALRASGRGAVVNISSTHAFHPRACMAQYDVAKAGIVSMTRCEVVGNNLQKRWADPREVAFPILWLASDEASFVNGTALMVDGGTVGS